MPTPISGIEARIQQARNRHQELHAHAAAPIVQQRQELRRLAASINAVEEAANTARTNSQIALTLATIAASCSLAALTVATTR